MRLIFLRVSLFTVLIASAGLVMADQKIKTKSNIKNDRLAESSASATSASASSAATKTEEKTKP